MKLTHCPRCDARLEYKPNIVWDHSTLWDRIIGRKCEMNFTNGSIAYVVLTWPVVHGVKTAGLIVMWNFNEKECSAIMPTADGFVSFANRTNLRLPWLPFNITLKDVAKYLVLV